MLNADREHLPDDAWGIRWFGWEPGEAGFWAATIQSIGTLCFNVSTFAALSDALEPRGEDLLVWLPDAYGSICFLIASWIAVREVCGGRPAVVVAPAPRVADLVAQHGGLGGVRRRPSPRTSCRTPASFGTPPSRRPARWWAQHASWRAPSC